MMQNLNTQLFAGLHRFGKRERDCLIGLPNTVRRGAHGMERQACFSRLTLMA